MTVEGRTLANLRCCVWYLVVWVPGVSCMGEPESRRGVGVIRRDSAGVVIVQSGAPSWDADTGWRVGRLRTSVGSVEDGQDDQLFRVFDATLLGDGSVAVANSGNSQIQVFSSSGGFLRGWGGPGDGPGEFQPNALRSLLSVEHDSLLAWDLYKQVQAIRAAGPVDYKPSSCDWTTSVMKGTTCARWVNSPVAPGTSLRGATAAR